MHNPGFTSRRRELLVVGVSGLTIGLAGCTDTTTETSAVDSETEGDTPTETATAETAVGTDTPEETSVVDPETENDTPEETTKPSGHVRINRVVIPDGTPSTDDVVQVLVEAQNDGEVTTDAELELRADAETVDAESVTLAPEETTNVTLSHSFASSGDHTLQVNEEPPLEVRVLDPFSPRISGIVNASPDGEAVDSRELSNGEYEYYVEIDNVGEPGEIGVALFWKDNLDGPDYGANTEFVEETKEYFDEGEAREMGITAGPVPDDKEGYLLRWTTAEFETTVTNEGSSGTADVQLLTISPSETLVHDRQEVNLSAEESETATLTVSLRELDTQHFEIEFEHEAEPVG